MKNFISSHLLLCLLLLCFGQLSNGHDEEKPAGKLSVIAQNIIMNNNATNTTSPSPTPAVTSKPPSSGQPTPAKIIHTHEPTKKYSPPPDDNDDKNDNNTSDEKKNKRVTIFWTLSCLAIIVFVLFYFRNNIAFFLGSVWRNTQRYGCKGLMHSLFPCFYRGLSSDGHQPLDQIIFETDEGSYTRSNLREGLLI